MVMPVEADFLGSTVDIESEHVDEGFDEGIRCASNSVKITKSYALGLAAAPCCPRSAGREAGRRAGSELGLQKGHELGAPLSFTRVEEATEASSPAGGQPRTDCCSARTVRRPGGWLLLRLPPGLGGTARPRCSGGVGAVRDAARAAGSVHGCGLHPVASPASSPPAPRRHPRPAPRPQRGALHGGAAVTGIFFPTGADGIRSQEIASHPVTTACDRIHAGISCRRLPAMFASRIFWSRFAPSSRHVSLSPAIAIQNLRPHTPFMPADHSRHPGGAAPPPGFRTQRRICSATSNAAGGGALRGWRGRWGSWG